MLVRSPLLTSHKWRELVSSGHLVCRCHDVFLWCYVCFVLLRFRLYAFVEVAALRSIVLRYTGAPIAARVSLFFFFRLFGDVAFSEYFLYHCRFLFVWRVRRTFFPSEWCFFYLVTTGWIFLHQLMGEFNQSTNQHINFRVAHHAVGYQIYCGNRYQRSTNILPEFTPTT